ncbi:MAG: diguanylate cyclase [Candidatus Alcyoniella australis]|nr:diguanylate cyclase [Candidatus Alcyoniella australis]
MAKADVQSGKPEGSMLDLKNQVAFLSSLVDAAKQLGNIIEPDEMFQALALIVKKALNCDAPALFVLDADTFKLRLAYCESLNNQEVTLPVGRQHIPRALHDGEHLLTEGGDEQTKQFSELIQMAMQGRCAFDLWVPILYEKQLIALLAIDKNIDDADLNFVNLLAKLAAVNIHNSLMLQRNRREKREQSKIIHNLSLLYNIGRALNHIDDLKKLLRYILRQALAVSHAEKGSIMLYDSDSDLLQIRVIEGLADKDLLEKINNGEVETKAFKPGEGVAGSVFKTGKSLMINKTNMDQRFVGANNSFANSIACIPMVVYKDVIGVINVTNKLDDSDFEDDDLNLLKMVADQAAVAINKAQLWEMAVTDSLTGLYIRRYFMVRFADEIKRAKRYNKIFSVVMADIDYFKNVNDTYGHPAGDKVLRSVAKVLSDQIREVDIVARYGGEEFVLLLPETPKEGALVSAERLRESVSQVEFDGMSSVTISLGVSTFPDDAGEIDELIKRADTALYQAKRDGRNRCVPYSEGLEKD